MKAAYVAPINRRRGMCIKRDMVHYLIQNGPGRTAIELAQAIHGASIQRQVNQRLAKCLPIWGRSSAEVRVVGLKRIGISPKQIDLVR